MRSRGLKKMKKKDLETLRKLMELKSQGFCQISRNNQGSAVGSNPSLPAWLFD
jgi:hypothetical protein